MESVYDIVVIGGGSGGYACALRAADLGLTVAVVERDKIGGTCLHRGCIPTKAMLRAAEVADLTRESGEYGIEATFDGVDIGALGAYKARVVGSLHRGLEGLIAAKGIAVVSGHGTLLNSRQVQVGDTVLRAGRAVVLATGSRPRLLPGIDVDGIHVLTSDHALSLDRVPRSVIVLGGGVIGVEFASAWRSLGADVTIVEMAAHLLPTEQESSSKRLERAFRKRRITQKLRAAVTSVEGTDGEVVVELDGGTTLRAEVALLAVGREPVTEGLGLDAAGITTRNGFVPVDPHGRTGVDGIFAIGDVRPGLQLAHLGFAEGMAVAERIAGKDPRPIDHDGVPRVAYCDPEVASVGLTSAAAAQRGHDVVETTYDLAGNGRNQIMRGAGAVTLVATADGTVLGVHLVGPHVGELIAEAQLITNLGLRADDVARLVHPHPTLAEAVGEAHLALVGRPLHAHG